MRRLWILLALLALRPALADVPPATVQALDLARFSGRWYEIARKPVFFERLCVRDIATNWRLVEDGSLKVSHSCRTASGAIDSARGRAVAQRGSGNSKLKVSYFWPFSSPYWALWLAPDYRAVLFGSPNRKYLWLLSRTARLDPALEQRALDEARRQGYNVNNLIRTPQTDRQP